ncbi:MAG: hypothetical protein K2I66_03190 [Bacteroidales bacterium]|nr:hypothetical protein [Bacteroidales bacterium]
MKKIVCSVMMSALFLWCACGMGAEADSATVADSAAKSLYMVGFCKNKKVSLRWAASTYPHWKRMMERGVILERYEFDAARYTPPVCKRIPVTPFLQQDTALLSEMARSDEYAAVLGEAVYSPDLQLDFGGSASDWQALKARMEQDALRFVLANLACDRSFAVACLSGMGYVDEDVRAGKYYLYRLYWPSDTTAAIGDSMVQVPADTAIFFTRLEETAPLGARPVAELQTEFKDGLVTLSWPHSPAGEPCVGYFIERTESTAPVAPRNPVSLNYPKSPRYTRLNQEIYADFVQDESHRVAYIDSLPNSDTEYRYRVLARDLFGNESVVAVSRPGKDIAYLHALPRLDSLQSDKKGERLFWSFPEEEQDRVEHFSLHALSAPSDILTGEPLVAAIPPDYRSCLLSKEQLPSTAYLYLTAHGKNGESKVSLPLFRQEEDSVPPHAPAQLRAEVDSASVLHLHWNAVPDPDCQGYRVFFKLSPQSEYVQLTTRPVADTFFVDTLSRITGQKFFYAVGAVDKRGNPSELSEWVQVGNGLPRPPVPPVFELDDLSDDQGVTLRWQNSPSAYLRGQSLYYKVDSSDWVLLHDYPKTSPDQVLPQSCYFKFPASYYNRRYTFRLSAYGEDREKDTVSAPFLRIVDHQVRLTAPRPMLLADRERHFVHLQWKNPERGDVRKICIYRRADVNAKEDGNAKNLLLAVLTGEEAKQGYYVDAQVKMNTDYAYRLQIQYADGSWSEHSPESSIEY